MWVCRAHEPQGKPGIDLFHGQDHQPEQALRANLYLLIERFADMPGLSAKVSTTPLTFGNFSKTA